MIVGFLIMVAWVIVLSFIVDRVKDKVDYQERQIKGLAKLLSDTRQSLDRAETARALGVRKIG